MGRRNFRRIFLTSDEMDGSDIPFFTRQTAYTMLKKSFHGSRQRLKTNAELLPLVRFPSPPLGQTKKPVMINRLPPSPRPHLLPSRLSFVDPQKISGQPISHLESEPSFPPMHSTQTSLKKIGLVSFIDSENGRVIFGQIFKLSFTSFPVGNKFGDQIKNRRKTH